MLVVTGTITCEPGREDEFIAAATAAVEATNGTEGCLEYTCSRSLSDPSAFVFVEAWTDGAALRGHIASKHYVEFRAAIDPIAASKVANIHTVEKTRTV